MADEHDQLVLMSQANSTEKGQGYERSRTPSYDSSERRYSEVPGDVYEISMKVL